MTVTFTVFGPPPTYDRWLAACPDCGVSEIGVRVINAGLAVLAAHSPGMRSVRRQRGRCAASERNVAAAFRPEVR